ncbi:MULTISPECIES: TlpA family protein disulfide reductase [Streptococcus]|uniref:TlpA family protein disulfide reductase n=1 Tax=Streptococcus caledonicus TaxID=2614158 RepID=A0ABW0UI23_9STRE|nr:TlpA disulfide reductase family protein [Streptococcus sp. S784/96/1]
MDKSDRWWLFSALATFIVGMSFWGLWYVNSQKEQSPSTPTEEVVGEHSSSTHELLHQQLPEFKMTNTDGKEVSSSEFYDKPMVIVDWASWCPHCQEHLPIIQKLYEEYGDRIHFVMINLTDNAQEPKSQVDAYVKENKFTFPYYYDLGQQAADSLKVEYLPTTYFVDGQQIIKDIRVSEMNEKELRQAIESLF